jgi:outer membrane immunogenic protein
MWTGFHAGINLGGGWGTSNNVYSASTPLSDRVADDINATIALINGYYPVTGSGMPWGTSALANTGIATVNQSGFVGGGQIGYSYQYGNLVVGLEADFQGSTIRGQGNYAGASLGNSTFQYTSQPGTFYNNYNNLGFGTGSISAGINWIGTVRGRLGYLVTPTILLYGTGGLAYGGVHASSTATLVAQSSVSVTPPAQSSIPPVNITASAGSAPSVGNFSGTRVGWTAGGGGEWLFAPNWSVKVEALYYNLGSVNFYSSPAAVVASTGYVASVNTSATRVNFAGVVARAGVNYHFNWFAPAPVVASY